MSSDCFKTTYSVEGAYGGSEIKTLYVRHNNSTDYTTFYDDNGEIQEMCFAEWEDGNDLWDAMIRLMNPYLGSSWDLDDKVEFCSKDDLIMLGIIKE